mmetsp:Transcript_19157/g.35586  ORF Transcript_19157/g.35586 Transcript_19157/m.35586 type:complete len:398 (-) Transcript_19157:61-1254(-)|eukprot:CAMPEP_0182497322 /NCGR_PEP_ID=MMETSP1321-20130603/5822_1 /TAXON_ID=91990 /ORGANISM="Bolidomonas sp., Strain RCC1657" /LENGTH=397 /DNA_ID=CAMNT_0024701165 /DNA_START=33 /DNA_END=1226 /DNA_ORIENTATION=+
MIRLYSPFLYSTSNATSNATSSAITRSAIARSATRKSTRNATRSRSQQTSLKSFSNSTDAKKDPKKSIHIFHRHGDRAPSSSILNPSSADYSSQTALESNFWSNQTYIPKTLPKNTTLTLHSSPQTSLQTLLSTPLNSHTPPFGTLTTLGSSQLKSLGSTLSLLYPHPIKTYTSTSYLRTILSSFSFISGFNSNNSTPAHVEVNVPSNEDNVLNMYDNDPDTIRAFIKEINLTPSFRSLSSPSSLLPKILSAFSPHTKKGRVDYIHLLDHFVCRRSHDLCYTDVNESYRRGEFDEEVDEVKRILEMRFYTYYTDPQLLKFIIKPLVNDVINKPCGLHVYSCHDVTVLSILYLFEKKVWEWPDYAAYVVVEIEEEEVEVFYKGDRIWKGKVKEVEGML